MAPSGDPKLDKISQSQPGLWRAFFNSRNIAGLAGAAVFGPGLQLGKTGAVAGYFLVRWAYSKTEQFVPFTKRRHIVLLPSVAGVLLQHTCPQVAIMACIRPIDMCSSTALTPVLEASLIAPTCQISGNPCTTQATQDSWQLQALQ